MPLPCPACGHPAAKSFSPSCGHQCGERGRTEGWGQDGGPPFSPLTPVPAIPGPTPCPQEHSQSPQQNEGHTLVTRPSLHRDYGGTATWKSTCQIHTSPDPLLPLALLGTRGLGWGRGRMTASCQVGSWTENGGIGPFEGMSRQEWAGKGGNRAGMGRNRDGAGAGIAAAQHTRAHPEAPLSLLLPGWG